MLTQKRIKELLVYDQDSGLAFWKNHMSSRVRSGDSVGCLLASGYTQVKIDGKKYQLHRVIFLYMTGRWPKDQIDHRNGSRSDNRWDNLREATGQQNQFNKAPGKGYVHNKQKRKLQAKITIDGKVKHLGYFDRPADAHAAYLVAREKFRGKKWIREAV